MSAQPKPAKRLPKARKPIRRSVRPSRVRETPSGAARRSADLIWAKAVRESGPCVARGTAHTIIVEVARDVFVEYETVNYSTWKASESK